MRRMSRGIDLRPRSVVFEKLETGAYALATMADWPILPLSLHGSVRGMNSGS
jgi:hypothetical protein